ncbi:MAG: ABC transporter permease subunit [Candidatus Electrothrix sp. AR3]|nr:ABC transporter permease subunit [Candidatus Electrothrix sp. AR3]
MGLILNMILSAVSLVVGMLIGLPLGAFRVMAPLWVRAPISLLLALIRATPLLLLVLWNYLFIQVVLVLPLEPLWIGCISLSLYALTHISDIVKAGTLAVSKEQQRTALALGLNSFQIARYVIIPVAVQVMIPAFTTFCTTLFKDSSVCYVIGVMELMRFGVLETTRHPQYILQYYGLVALLFFIVTMSGAGLARLLERRCKIRGTIS